MEVTGERVITEMKASDGGESGGECRSELRVDDAGLRGETGRVRAQGQGSGSGVGE